MKTEGLAFLVSLVPLIGGCTLPVPDDSSGPGSGSGGSNGGSNLPACRTFQAMIVPPPAPAHLYLPPGPIVVQEMSNVDLFWGSRTQAVVYGPDQPSVMGNALSEPDGYIYYDPNFIAMLDARTFSYAPSQMVFAHEFGHQIQFVYGTFHNDNLQDELGADCYAGYLVAWLACRKAISDADVMNDFQTMCALGSSDPGLPWWASGAHGNCQQRTSAFASGVQAYSAGLPPLNGCTL
jgi:hypothetical protein